jgi:hypothetical protein
MNAGLWLIGIVAGVVACAYAATLWGARAAVAVAAAVLVVLLAAQGLGRRAARRP